MNIYLSVLFVSLSCKNIHEKFISVEDTGQSIFFMDTNNMYNNNLTRNAHLLCTVNKINNIQNIILFTLKIKILLVKWLI